MEKSFGILKPDILSRNLIGKVLSKIEERFKIVDLKMVNLNNLFLEEFYAEHKHKSFFKDMLGFMAKKVVVFVVEGNNAVAEYRKLMGTTNPALAQEGSLRKEFGISIDENSVHGSASLEEAEKEIKLANKFFNLNT